MLNPYDHELLWQGHASMVSEIAHQLPPGTAAPDALFASVGGGGLLGGLLVGCAQQHEQSPGAGAPQTSWSNVRIFALETHGSDCFYQSFLLNKDSAASPNENNNLPGGVIAFKDKETGVHVARLPAITSCASSLGARSPSPRVLRKALSHPGKVTCVTVSDERSMKAAVEFADEHKLLVELACSTTLVPAYNPALFHRLVDTAGKSKKTVVFIVCGGFKVTAADLMLYKQLVAECKDFKDVYIDGTSFAC